MGMNIDSTQCSSENDRHYMSIALEEAQRALNVGDYPVGAVLVVDGELWGQARNAMFSDGRTIAYAEHILFDQLSARLRQKRIGGQPEYSIVLYTTLEPCLMCLGTAIMHHVSKIVVACPDPNGGATGLDQRNLGSAYQKRWPQYAIGPFREESRELIIEFLKMEKFKGWRAMLKQFQSL